MHTIISISENGFFIGDDRIRMLENEFAKIMRNHHFYRWKDAAGSDSNCAVCYTFYPKDMAFINEMDVWFPADGEPLNGIDFAKIEAFYAERRPRLNEQGNKFKFCANVSLDILKMVKPAQKFDVPVGIDDASFNCTFYQPSEVGLNVFKLFINPLYSNEDVERPENQKINQLWAAVSTGNLAKVEELINEGVDVKFVDPYRRITALDVAIAKNNTEMCRLLIKHGATVN